MKIVICDDDEIYIDIIKSALKEYMDLKRIQYELETFLSGEDLLDGNVGEYDICILDVKMVGLDGYETARRIRRRNLHSILVFLTNYPDFSGQGYDVDAEGYIRKWSIGSEAFRRTVQKAVDCYNRKQDRLQIFVNGEPIDVSIPNILYLEKKIRKIRIVMNKECFYHNQEFYGDFENIGKILGPKLFNYSHHSYLVNLRSVKQIEKSQIILGDDKSVPLSRSYAKQFRHNYTMSMDMLA